MHADPHDLERFVVAQDPVFDRVTAELAAGTKRSHWMWFVFPQLRGLGASPMATRFAIRSAQQARAYLDHPVLGPRLRACVSMALTQSGKTARDLFGSPDDLKFRSSLTLFAAVSDDPLFASALAQFYDGEPDPATLAILASDP